MNKKAQTATEYIIIFAVVLIIALIAVGVLGGIPSFGSTARHRASSTYWQEADIGITAYSFDPDAAGTDDVLVIMNHFENSISITSISLDGTRVYSTSTSFAPGEQKTINIDQDCGNSAGDMYTFKVEINYTADETGTPYTFSGEGHNLEGVCSI